MSKFANVSTTAKAVPTADIAIEGLEGMRPVITMRPANEDNPAYFNALLKRQRQGRRGRGRNITTKDVQRMRMDDVELLAEHCAQGWSSAPVDAEGKPVAFSKQDCKDLFAAIVAAPNGRELFDSFRDECSDPFTFMREDEEDVDTVAGN